MVKCRTLAGLVLTSLCGCTGLIDDWPQDALTAGTTPKPVVLPKVVVAEPLHRLNRVEYDNTVRDLLGTSLTPARAFPPDTAVGGFDNVADALTIPASLFALYNDAAKDLADHTLRIAPRYVQTLESRALGIAGTQPGSAFETWGWSLSGRFTGTLKVPQAETVTLSLLLGGGRTSAAAVPIGSLWVDGAKLQTWTITAPAAAPQPKIVKIALAPGNHQVQVSFDNLFNDPAANQGNQLILGNITATSDAQAVPPNRSKIYVCDPAKAAEPEVCAAQIVRTFAERAWRRPLTDTETEKLDALYTALAASEGSEEAIALSVRAILVSPKFLFRPSFAAAGTKPRPLNDYVLASRLSYFLWSTMPDDALLADAASGALRTDAGLRAAVTRMLASEKAIALRKGFGAAWLGATALDTATPEPSVFPTFDPALKGAMAEEAELFFEDFLRNGQPVTAMLTPDFGFRNDALSRHYGMNEVRSDTIVKVQLKAGERRGILSQGAWLTSSSDPAHTSPVRRGRWVLEQLLGTEIPPPPPGIPALPADSSAGTIREKLAVHRLSPACASCHNQVDPIGLGLEEYDGVGQRRAFENGNPVDSSGALAGRGFNGAEELATLVARDPRFVPSLVGKLHAYAMGRGKVKEDKAFVIDIAQKLDARGLRLDALIELVVLSESFRNASEVAP